MAQIQTTVVVVLVLHCGISCCRIVILNVAVSYQQRCCVEGQVAGLRLHPLGGWSRAPQPWRCWSPAAGCWPPESTPSTGCRCPAWTPWGGGRRTGLPPASPPHSGRCCRCWWQTGWSLGLSVEIKRERERLNIIHHRSGTSAKCLVSSSHSEKRKLRWTQTIWKQSESSGIRSMVNILHILEFVVIRVVLINSYKARAIKIHKVTFSFQF